MPIIKTIIAIFFFILTISTLSAEIENVRYYIDEKDDSQLYHSLSAEINHNTYPVITENDEECLFISSQKDFDDNGFTDVLLGHTTCGGNCCPNSFSIVYYDGKGGFKKGKSFGESWQDPIIQKWKNKWSVTLISNSEGYGNTELEETTTRFVFDQGKATKIAESITEELEAEVNLRSSEFNPEIDDQIKSIQFDLNNDGIMESINAKYWMRWGSMIWDVKLPNNETYSPSVGCKRIGVLKSTNNGMHDLICNQSTIYQWNGTTYQKISH